MAAILESNRFTGQDRFLSRSRSIGTKSYIAVQQWPQRVYLGHLCLLIKRLYDQTTPNHQSNGLAGATRMKELLAEFIGTAILLLMGNGVVANVLLPRTKGSGSGWHVIAAGWGMAVFTAVWCADALGSSHLNPAVTVGLAVAGQCAWSTAPGLVLAQLSGAAVGGLVGYLFYKPHYDVCDDPDAILATFCTAPNIRNLPSNTGSEAVATFILVFAVIVFVEPSLDTAASARVGLGSLGALPVGLIVYAIGLSLGGTTGHALNPARDLGPRLVHFLLPIAGKRDSDWGYAAIPVLGPLLGGVVAGVLARSL